MLSTTLARPDLPAAAVPETAEPAAPPHEAEALERQLAALPEAGRIQAARPLVGAFIAKLMADQPTAPDAPNPCLTVLRLVERHPWLVAGNHLWLDRLLRPQRGLAVPARLGLWAIALQQRPGPAQTLGLMTLADNARALDLYGRCADRLHALLLEGAALPAGEVAPAWCRIGDTALLRRDPAGAEAHYRQALAIQPGDGRALLGLACVALDQNRLARAAELGQQAAEAFAAAGHAETAQVTRRGTTFWAAARPIASVEVVIFCHVSSKLKQNAHLGAPGLGLLELGLASLRARLRPGPEVPITIYYDHRISPVNNAFLANLSRLCAEQDLRLAVYTGNGLRRQWLRAFERSEADALLIIEQDHEFLETCPPLAEVQALLQTRPDINQLRLNRRRNKAVGVDTMLLQTHRDRASGLCRTAGFSNTPQLLRRDFYEAVVRPAIEERSLHDHRNFGAAGVEENLNNLIRRIEPQIGMTALQRLMGLAIWGVRKAEPACVHTGV